jgi:iron complex outermembrane receptor protein
MEHRDYDGYFPDGDDLTIAFDRNQAHGGYNAGRDMFGSTKEGSRAQINVGYSGDSVEFNSWTHIANMDVSQQYDIDKEVLPWHLVEFNVWGPTKLFSQEFRLSTNNDGPFNMAAGVLYWHEKMTQNSNNTTGMAHGSRCLIKLRRDFWGNVVSVQDLGLSYFAGPCGYTDTEIAPHAAALGAARPVTALERDTNHASLYAMFDYDFSEKMSMSLEMRWTDERERMTGPVYNGNFGVDSCPDNPYGDCIDAPSGGPGSVILCGSGGRCDFVGNSPFPQLPATVPAGWRGYAPVPMKEGTFRAGGDYISPKLTLSYQVSDDVLLFGSFAEARKPGGFSTLGIGAFSLDPNADGNPEENQFDEEIMDVFELGFKSVLRNGSLRLNGALFYEDYTDRQVSVQRVIGDQLGNVIRNAAGGEVFGAEIDLALAVSDQVTLTGGYSYLDSKYTDFKLTSTGAGEISRAGNCSLTTVGVETTCIIDRTGKVFERAPKHAANINLNYSDELMDTGAMFFTELNARYQDDRAVDFDNNAWFKEYWRLDFRAGISKGSWEGILYVKNLLDDDTVISGGNGPDIGNSDFRFGMVFTDCAKYPGGLNVEQVLAPDGTVLVPAGYDGGCYIPGQNPNGKKFAPSITAAPSIGNAWYASVPDPRQVGIRVKYSF